MITKVIDNFGGRLTRENIGDMNSGRAKYATTFGNDPFAQPGQLSWQETPIRIDSGGTVITDMIMAGKERIEAGITYVYAIGHLARLYKIQVNDTASKNANYDNPVLITTLITNLPTFTRGASMEFFGTTEQIWIGHDKGVTRINFDGTGEAFVGVLGSWTQTVPRPLRQFIGNIYAGNGTNIAEITQAAVVNSYTKLSPGFPANTQVRDMGVNLTGTYLEIIVARLALPDLTSIVQDTTFMSSFESYIFKWNGVDTGYTSFQTYPSFSINTSVGFGSYNYTFGYDLVGATVFDSVKKLLTPVLTIAPLPNAVGANGNLVGWATTEYYPQAPGIGNLRMCNFIYGPLDNEIGIGWWRQMAMSATGTETDILRIPWQILISNWVVGSSSNGYPGNIVSNGKIYFSTIETSASPTTKYKLYKWFPVPTTVLPYIGGVYETQNELSIRLFRNILKRKLKVHRIRVYTQSLVANNSFRLDLIGRDLSVLAGGSYTFTVGTTATAGNDLVEYTPAIAPQHSLGLRITNLGSKNWVCNKIEIDIDESGQ
jgi:hypothetical protein